MGGMEMNRLGSLTGGFLTILIGAKLEEERRLKELYKDSWYSNRHKLHEFNDYQFRGLIKLAVVGELK